MRSVQQGDITVLNTHASNIRTPTYIKQVLTELKGKIDSNTIIIIGDFSNPFHQWIDHPDRKSLRKQQT
jgi:tricorn protease-like protein